MSVRTVGKLTSLAITLEAAQASLPTPTVIGDGGDISSWQEGAARTGRTGVYSPDIVHLEIDADAAITLDAPTVLFGWENDNAVWREFKVLNGAAVITLNAALGFDERVEGCGVYDRLAVGSAQTGVGNTTVVATPLEVVDE